MKALDLFCGGGGAAIGLHQAGFTEIVGVDIKPHPNYPFDFVQADIHDLPVNVADFDFVWASPPCQLFSLGSRAWKRKGANWKNHPDLIPITRETLKNHPFTCIENVPQAPIRPDLFLWGVQFGLEKLWEKKNV